MRAVRRVMLLGVAAVCAGAGSALFASSALAGGVDPNNNGLLSAAIYNLTPYTWTLVSAQAPANPPGNSTGGGGWNTSPASTIQPGAGSLYRLNPWQALSGGFCGGDNEYNFDAYITYRVDVLGGPPEYANLVIWGPWNRNVCLNGGHSADPGFAVYFTSSPPAAGYDSYNQSGAAPAAEIPNPQLTYQHNVPFAYDQTFQIVGNYTVDASTNLGPRFVSVLNTLCTGGEANTNCSFTQVGPLTWGTGDTGSPWAATNCPSAGSKTNTYTVGYTATVGEPDRGRRRHGVCPVHTLRRREQLDLGQRGGVAPVDGNGDDYAAEHGRHPAERDRVSVVGAGGGQGDGNAGRFRRILDVHRNQLLRDAQWGDHECPHPGVRRDNQGAADDRRGAAGALHALSLLDVDGR